MDERPIVCVGRRRLIVGLWKEKMTSIEILLGDGGKHLATLLLEQAEADRLEAQLTGLRLSRHA